jgi:acid phosphatase
MLMNLRLGASFAVVMVIAACRDSHGVAADVAGGAGMSPSQGQLTVGLADVQTIVIVYAENRSFDGLFGRFPGAAGLDEVLDSSGVPTAAYHAQLDRDGTTVLTVLPPTWTGATAAGNRTTISQAMTMGLPNAPFPLEVGFGAALSMTDVTRDMAHRFFEHVMEINSGTNDMFAAWLDSGGITMGHWDYSSAKLYALAKQYVVADRFFQAAYGGSFLNHQYLICACAPQVPDDFVNMNKPSVNVLTTANAKGVTQLDKTAVHTASALDGPPGFKTGNLAPQNYFGDGDGYRAVNTMQPPYQPSGNAPMRGASGDGLAYADASSATTLPPQTATTIGDLLSAKGIDWGWYATAWDAALTDGKRDASSSRKVIYAPSTPGGSPNFQPHHQPFNYYEAFDPKLHAEARQQHLKDYKQLTTEALGGKLPAVVFYKPQGNFNQHPGYANLADADDHIAELVATLQSGPQWEHMLILITYDEYGGQWDHVAPPQGDLIGPGTRVPAIIVSPYTKLGTVDHTQYDTASVLRLITRRFELQPLEGLAARDKALTDNGGTSMGDLTASLALDQHP